MKTFKSLTFGLFAGLLALTVVTLSSPITAEAASAVAAPTVIQAPADDLTEQEVLDLQFMVEEEKLARDVYLTLYEAWDFRIFQNIARSEQTHMDAIRTLLTTYGVEDPTIGKDSGEFDNPVLQELYDDLTETGSESLADALLVGALIEEIDILDLEERIALTDKDDVQFAYENLLKGSENHLRAFVSTWERQTGEDYKLQDSDFDQDRFDEIMSESRGSGNGRGGRGGGQGGGRGNGGGRWG